MIDLNTKSAIFHSQFKQQYLVYCSRAHKIGRVFQEKIMHQFLKLEAQAWSKHY